MTGHGLQEVDIETMMEEIRRRLREPPTFVPPAPAPVPATEPSPSCAPLLEEWQVERVTFVSDRPVVGPLVTFAKRVLRRLLTPILARQSAFNLRVARVLEATIERQATEAAAARARIEGIERRQAEVADSHHAVRTLLEQHVTTAAAWWDNVGRWNEAFNARQDQLDERHGGLERDQRLALERLGRVERAVRRLAVGAPPAGADPLPRPIAPAELGFDYVGFEDRHRGSEEEVRSRQRAYLDAFRGAAPVLDVGCGRGEFLDLLREAGIAASGVDRSLDLVLHCREKGHDVVHADAFVHLDALDDSSLGGIFAAQFVEHLHPAQIVRFVRLCARRLRPGGRLVLETPNPQCLAIFARSFYMDFSHVWPCHPEAMRYLLESEGFTDVRLVFSSPVDPTLGFPPLASSEPFGEHAGRFDRTAEFVNALLLGPQDYAVIGRRMKEV